MDKGAWQATVHGVAKSWTQLNQVSMHHARTRLKRVGEPGLMTQLACSLLWACRELAWAEVKLPTLQV